MSVCVLMGTMGRSLAIRGESVCMACLPHVNLPEKFVLPSFVLALQPTYLHIRGSSVLRSWLRLSNKYLNTHYYSALMLWTTQRVAHCTASWKSFFWHVKVLPNPDSPSSKPMYIRTWASLCVTGLPKHYYHFESSLSITLLSVF